MKKLFLFVIITSIFLTGCNNFSYKSDKNSKILKKTVINTDVIPEESRKLLSDGNHNLSAGNISAAIDDFSDMTKLYPNTGIGYYNLGLAYAKNNQYIDAVNVWEKLTTINNSYPNVYYNLGRAYEILKNNKKASQNYCQYLILKPNDTEANTIKSKIKILDEPSYGVGIIGKVLLSDKIDPKNKLIDDNYLTFYSKHTKKIYTSINIINAVKNTKLDLNWYYIAFQKDRVPVNSKSVIVSGTKNIVLSLDKPMSEWPNGEYQLDILINGIENLNISFYIQ